MHKCLNLFQFSLTVLFGPECVIEQITENDKLVGGDGALVLEGGTGLRCLVVTGSPHNVSFAWHHQDGFLENFTTIRHYHSIHDRHNVSVINFQPESEDASNYR